jgi:hypothetical protein
MMSSKAGGQLNQHGKPIPETGRAHLQKYSDNLMQRK